MFSLKGKTALITGASGGLGQEIAQALHAQGTCVVLSGTREAALREVAQNFQDKCHILPCDLSQSAAAEGLWARAEALGAPIDILINNAGITRDNLLLRMKDEDFEAVLHVNLTSAFILMRAAVKSMMKRRHGRIINISSVVGVMGNPGQANYCASKAGLIGLSKSVAQEVASRGITVNCIAPGFMASNMTHRLTEDQKTKISASIPLGKMGHPRDIAAAAVYLSSDEANYVTGQTLHVNGGMAMI